jgi:hypothetical protein
MATEGNNTETSSTNTGSSKRKWLITLVILGSIIAALVFFFPRSAANDASGEQKKEPLLHRDEPTKEQIFQEDYKDKVHEMLDSGKSVKEVSRETGIRKDVVRKIKNGKE